MILITPISEDGKEVVTLPGKTDDVNKCTADFIEFCQANPAIVLGAKTAKIRRVVEMEEISEITLPEVDIMAVLKNFADLMKMGLK